MFIWFFGGSLQIPGRDSFLLLNWWCIEKSTCIVLQSEKSTCVFINIYTYGHPPKIYLSSHCLHTYIIIYIYIWSWSLCHIWIRHTEILKSFEFSSISSYMFLSWMSSAFQGADRDLETDGFSCLMPGAWTKTTRTNSVGVLLGVHSFDVNNSYLFMVNHQLVYIYINIYIYAYIQGVPLPVKNGFITPLTGIITAVTYIYFIRHL